MPKNGCCSCSEDRVMLQIQTASVLVDQAWPIHYQIGLWQSAQRTAIAWFRHLHFQVSCR